MFKCSTVLNDIKSDNWNSEEQPRDFAKMLPRAILHNNK